MRFGEEQIADAQAGEAVGPVLVALPLLVGDHVALRPQLLLVQRVEEVPHAVGFHPERGRELVGRHDLEIVRPVEVRGAVHSRGADALQHLDGRRLHVLRPGEHHVLEEVGEPAAARRLVGGADVIPDVHCDLRQAMVLAEDDRQPVLQLVLLELDVGVRGARAKGERQATDRGDPAHGRPPARLPNPRGAGRQGANSSTADRG